MNFSLVQRAMHRRRLSLPCGGRVISALELASFDFLGMVLLVTSQKNSCDSISGSNAIWLKGQIRKINKMCVLVSVINKRASGGLDHPAKQQALVPYPAYCINCSVSSGGRSGKFLTR